MHHEPVMVDEVTRYVLTDRTRLVVDATVGYGGHAEAILAARSAVRLIGIDRDAVALAAAAARLRRFGDRVTLAHTIYSDLPSVLRGVAPADGILLDLGLSSPQIDDPSRGFAHSKSGPLDMRMGGDGETAAERVRRSSLDEIATLLREYGEVRRSRRVARAIRAAVDRDAMATTTDLREAVMDALGPGTPPAELSRVFQAVRIAVNDELGHLREFLRIVIASLRTGGRLVVLSYHSLEDRMVKEFMRDAAATCVCPPTVPVCVCGRSPELRILTRRAVRAGDAEVARNPRARSAVLRAAEKVERGRDS
jgi:16S rRNA (cytosine1402-N4)-methyltransferase